MYLSGLRSPTRTTSTTARVLARGVHWQAAAAAAASLALRLFGSRGLLLFFLGLALLLVRRAVTAFFGPLVEVRFVLRWDMCALV